MAFVWVVVVLIAWVGWQSSEPGLRDYLAQRHALRTSGGAAAAVAPDPAANVPGPEIVLIPREWAYPTVITKAEIIRGRRLPVIDVETDLLDRARQLVVGTSPFDPGPVNEVRELVAASGWFDPQSVIVIRDLVPAAPGEATAKRALSSPEGEPDQPAASVSSARATTTGTADGRVIVPVSNPVAASGAAAEVGESPGTPEVAVEPTLVDRVVIRARWRQPMALVRSDDRDFVVDSEGIVLPITYPAGEVDMLPVIFGVRAQPPLQVGERWPGMQVQAGLSLWRYLAELPGDRYWLREMAGIDVANSDGRNGYQPRLSLVARDGYRIAWGRAVGDEKGIDQPARKKVELLDDFFLQRPRITDPNVVVRVPGPLGTIERPIVSPPDAHSGSGSDPSP